MDSDLGRIVVLIMVSCIILYLAIRARTLSNIEFTVLFLMLGGILWWIVWLSRVERFVTQKSKYEMPYSPREFALLSVKKAKEGIQTSLKTVRESVPRIKHKMREQKTILREKAMSLAKRSGKILSQYRQNGFQV